MRGLTISRTFGGIIVLSDITLKVIIINDFINMSQIDTDIEIPDMLQKR